MVEMMDLIIDKKVMNAKEAAWLFRVLQDSPLSQPSVL